MRRLPRTLGTIVAAMALGWSLLPSASLAVAAPKVVIIVGPTGSLTDNYRNTGNQIADAASAAGANVVKVYSPKATWSRVKNAVAGANIIIYLGHGNGYPNPYSGTEYTDRDNGWGLNRSIWGGDSDDWSKYMVYCGEKALLGTLSSSDGAAQWKYCGGSSGNDGINPAANFVMIYKSACYTPGASEGWDTKATESVALQRVRNYSYPVLDLGAGAYFATDMYHGASQLVTEILGNPDMAFGEIAMNANGYDASAQRHFEHPDLSGDEIWLQRTANNGGNWDYWLAYAGMPARTPSGGTAGLPGTPQITDTTPPPGSKWSKAGSKVRIWFDEPVENVTNSTFQVLDDYGFRVPAGGWYVSDEQKAVRRPRSPLQPLTWYTVVVSSGIHNADGVPLTAQSWTFRTESFTADGSVENFSSPASLHFAPGTQTGFQFDTVGRQTAVKTATLTAASGASAATRRVLVNQSGTWFYVTNGIWAGYWLRESPALYLASETAPLAPDESAGTYDPYTTVDIGRGTHTGYLFDSSGNPTAQKTRKKRASTAQVSALQAIPGQTGLWFKVESGTWSGYWLRASDVVHLAS